MKTTLSFDDEKVKNLLSKFDVIFFLEQNFSKNDYAEDDKKLLHKEFESQIIELKKKRKENPKQFNLYLEGQTGKMFRGGFLPALFHLDDTKEFNLFDFKTIGKDLAYFKLWQDYHNKKITKKKIWSYIIKIGSILGIILSIIKVISLFTK